MKNIKNCPLVPLTSVLEKIIDNRGKTVPTVETGFPLIATNCIKHSSIYPTFENIRYVSNQTLQTWFRAELKPNDILFVNKGTPGRVCLVPNPITFCAAQDMIGLRCDSNKIYYKYLFAILRSEFIQTTIANYHVGIAIPHFKKADMDNLMIPLPDMMYQKKIGDLYCILSEKIELNNSLNIELDSMIKTIYDYWFLQFNFIVENNKAYKNSGGTLVWNDKLKRNIPEKWNVKKLSDVIDTIIDHRGKTPKKLGGDWSIDGITALSAKIVKNEKIVDVEKANKVSREMYEKWMPEKLANGDILMTSEAPLGEFYYINIDTEYCLSQRLFAIRANNKDVLSSYLYYELSRGHGYSQIMGSKSGSTVFGIRQEELKRINILIPDVNVQKKFDERVSPILKQIRINEKENRELTELREFIFPLVINGQITFE